MIKRIKRIFKSPAGLSSVEFETIRVIVKNRQQKIIRAICVICGEKELPKV